MKPKPDNRRDNVKHIQNNIDQTIKNTRLANEMIEKTSDQNMKKALEEKNERREAALQSMRNEIKDEADFQKHQE